MSVEKWLDTMEKKANLYEPEDMTRALKIIRRLREALKCSRGHWSPMAHCADCFSALAYDGNEDPAGQL